MQANLQTVSMNIDGKDISISIDLRGVKFPEGVFGIPVSFRVSSPETFKVHTVDTPHAATHKLQLSHADLLRVQMELTFGRMEPTRMIVGRKVYSFLGFESIFNGCRVLNLNADFFPETCVVYINDECPGDPRLNRVVDFSL